MPQERRTSRPPPPPRPSLILPFLETLPSGLLIPRPPRAFSEMTPRRRTDLSGANLAVIYRHRGPEAEIGVFADEAALGRTPSSLSDVIAHVETLPFEPALVFTALLTAAHWQVRFDGTGQLRLFTELFPGTPLTERLATFLAESRGRVPISEQHLFLLTRLILEHAPEGKLDEGLTDAQFEHFIAALFGVGTLIGSAAGHLQTGSPKLDAWLAYFVQNGLYYAIDSPDLAIGRTYAIFREIATSTEARQHPQYRDFDSMLRAGSGFSVMEQLAAGIASYAGSNSLSPDVAFAERSRVTRGYYAPTAFGEQEDVVWKMLSGDRDWYRKAFADLPADAASLAWFNTPLLARPWAALSDGLFLLTSPRAITTWCADGFYYRLLDAASQGGDREVNAYTAFVGSLVETYARELMSWAHGQRPTGGGRVWGEQPYGDARKTSDVAVDHGLDLVLIEVVASRIRRPTRVAGDLGSLETDLYRTVIKKIGELAGCIEAVLGTAGRPPQATIPGVDPRIIERVWPIVVTMEGIIQHPPLWARVNPETEAQFRDSRVQALTLLDIGDLETLAAAVRHGTSLVSMLARKTAPNWRYRSLNSWLSGDPGAPRARACDFTLSRFEEATRAIEPLLVGSDR